jgi:hypothetical protein
MPSRVCRGAGTYWYMLSVDVALHDNHLPQLQEMPRQSHGQWYEDE